MSTLRRRLARLHAAALLSIALPVSTLAAGCSELLTFEVSELIGEQRVPGDPTGGVLTDLLGADVPIQLDLSAESAARNTGPISRVTLRSLSFSITATGQSDAADVDTFDFVSTLDILVSSARPDTTLPRIVVATLETPPPGARVVALTTSDVNLKAYIEEGAVIESAATGTVPRDDVTFNGRAAFTLRVF